MSVQTINPFSPKCGQGQNSTKIHKFLFVKFWKQIAPFVSTGREVLFEWYITGFCPQTQKLELPQGLQHSLWQ